MREYPELVGRVLASTDERVRSRTLGHVDGLPLLHVHVGAGDPAGGRALLIGGTHGDEPAGVEALLTWLAAPPPAWLQHLSFDVLPCTNPTGYVRDTRANAAGIDLNWSWDRDGVPEIDILRAFLAGRRYRFVFDLHEDWESAGFYMYEHVRSTEPVGEAVIDRVRPLCAVNEAATIEGWPARGGIVHADSSRERLARGDGFPLVLLRDHTDHKMTTETPTQLPLERRVRVQRAALDAVVETYLGRPA